MNTLTVTTATFNEMISGLIKSGVTFKATEVEGLDLIKITFEGGY